MKEKSSYREIMQMINQSKNLMHGKVWATERPVVQLVEQCMKEVVEAEGFEWEANVLLFESDFLIESRSFAHSTALVLFMPWNYSNKVFFFLFLFYPILIEWYPEEKKMIVKE